MSDHEYKRYGDHPEDCRCGCNNADLTEDERLALREYFIRLAAKRDQAAT